MIIIYISWISDDIFGINASIYWSFPDFSQNEKKKNENQSLQGNYYNPYMYNDWIIRVNAIQISIGDIPIRN